MYIKKSFTLYLFLILLIPACDFISNGSPSIANEEHLENPAIAISVGGVHACALLQSKEVVCWGDNTSGQLGNGTFDKSPVPVKVQGLGPSIALAAGGGHTCAILETGTVMCWGGNDKGQIGDGGAQKKNTPVEVLGVSGDAVSIIAGLNHTCVVIKTGGVKCWGENIYGQIGNGEAARKVNKPVEVNLQGSVSSVAAGNEHTCGLLITGKVVCWGSNSSGQLGNGGVKNSSKSPMGVIELQDVVSVSAGFSNACAITNDGSVFCWGWIGYQNFSDKPVRMDGFSKAVSVASGSGHICVALADGSVGCLGDNSKGQLGVQFVGFTLKPVSVSGLNVGAKMLSANFDFTCALLVNGVVQCWGDNANGQLGNGNTESSAFPVEVLLSAGEN